MNDQDVLEALLDDASLDGLLLFKTATPGKSGTEGCWIGGRPTLPRDLDWPIYSDRKCGDIPLVFVAQIDLAALPFASAQTGLPDAGTLFFFFEPLRGSRNDFDEGGSRVLYTPHDVSSTPPRTRPKYPEFEPDIKLGRWHADGPDNGLKQWNFNFMEVEGTQTNRHRMEGYHEAAWARVCTMQDEVKAQYRGLEGTRGKVEFKLHNMFIGPYGTGWEDDEIPLLTIWYDPNLCLHHADQRVLVFSISEKNLIDHNFDAVRLIDAG